MTKKIVTRLGTVVVLLSILEPHARAQRCSAKDSEQLAPAAVTDEFRAAAWGAACSIILQNGTAASGKGSPRSPGCARKAAVVAFCKDPIAAPVPFFLDVECVRAEIEGVDRFALPGATALPSAPFFVGSAFQDDLLRGFAQFIVSRAKAEGLAFAIQRLKDKLCKSSDAQAMLPNTCALVAKSDPTGGTPMAWGTLKTAFETDLERLPDRAIACVMAKGDAFAVVSDILITGVQAARLIRHGEDLVAVAAGLVHRFPESACEGRSESDQVHCALHMFGFSVRLLAPSTNGGGAARLDADGFRIAARLLCEHAKHGGVCVFPLDKTKAQELAAKLAHLHDGLIRLAKKVERAAEALRAAKQNDARLDSVVRLATALVNLAREALPLVPDGQLNADIKVKIKTALDTVETLASAIDAAVERDYARTFLYVAEAVRRFDETLKLPDELLKYGPFVAEVAAAKTPEDVQRALEMAAAPVGGSLAKRGNGRRTVAVSAFVGVQGGREAVDDTDVDATVAWQGGLFAPVGIDVSWGVRQMQSVGVFVSLIDLGALMSFRRQTETETSGAGGMPSDASVESTPEIGFKQVLSPGVHFVWGIDRFALGAGVALSPGLRRVEQDGEVVEADASSFRFGVFAAIDVTIFPF